MQGDKRTSYECPTRGNLETDDHLLSGRGQQAPAKAPIHPISKVVIKVPAPFRYSSDMAVPWNYTNQVTSQELQVVRVSPETKQELSVNDIVGISGLTHSGRCYAPGPSGVKEGEESTG